MTMMLTDTIRLFLFPLLMAFSAFSDLFTMTISNRVSLLLIAGFALMAALIGMSPMEVLSHVGAGLVVLAVTFTFFTRGWIGGGDAKLAAATALWLGFPPLMEYLLIASVLGGALTLLILQFRTMLLPMSLIGKDWAERLHHTDSGIPYGIALAVAAIMVYPQSVWMKPLGF